jgi:hypothetical protein
VRHTTEDEWRAEGEALFGPDILNWRFVCPVCKCVAAGIDWKAAGARPNDIGFSCVGRWLPDARNAFEGSGKGPCNYTGGGLFRLNPVEVARKDGQGSIAMFEFHKEAA